MQNKILEGDCLEVMRGMEENSVDAIVCDPPYELTSIVKRFGKKGSAPAKQGTDGRFSRLSKGFMGKTWDGTGIAMRPEVWEECLRVTKPGAYLLAFGGTRTFHRLACAIEDAGWTLKDTLSWNYGSGFPKSHDVSKALDRKAGAEPKAKQWDGFGTALKPAWEPIILAQKPIEGACSEELHAITRWRRWHTKAPKESWRGKPEEEESWHASKCYKICQTHGLDYWERPADEGNIERWVFERRWDALEPKAQGRHVVIGKNKRVVLSRKQYKNKQYVCDAANVLKWGCGALNIDACRIGATDKQLAEKYASVKNAPARKNSIYGKDARARSDSRLEPHHQGRWPANFLLSHTIFCEKVGEREAKGYQVNTYSGRGPFGKSMVGEKYESEKQGGQMVDVYRCIPDCPVGMLDEQSGETVTRPHGGKGERLDTQGAGWRFRRMPSTLSDRGGASRFFYCAKASRRERNAGLEGFGETITDDGRDKPIDNPYLRGETKRSNSHPTVKPIALLCYLCRLVTPPAGTVLDCFTGSGSTGCAAALEGFEFIGIEKEKGYAEIARARIAHFSQGSP